MFPLFAIFYDVKSLILHLPVASPMFFLSIIWRCNQQWTASDKIWSAFFQLSAENLSIAQFSGL